MSDCQSNPPAVPCPPTVEDLRRQTRERLDEIMAYCVNDQGPASFLEFETALLGLLRSLGCLLIQLFLQAHHDRLDPAAWRARGYRVADPAAGRTLKTSCGPVAYIRAFLVPRHGGGPGVHPLDVTLGLTRDAYSPLVIGWFCRLATRVSFQVASGLGGMFLGAAPPSSAIEEWVLGLARPAYVYMSEGPLPAGDGDVLVIEIDGKAVPTAMDQEMARRRRPRCEQNRGCKCQRHRGRAKRQRRGRRKRRKKGDKSKNGRSATLVVMYTLRRGEDGRLHGPLNKKVFGTFGSRKSALEWARVQATRRGFPAGTAKTVQIVVDGETCLERRLRRLFRGADPDAGRPARAGEALGGGQVVPPRRERGVGGLGRGLGGVALQRACSGTPATFGAGDEGDRPSRPRDEGEARDPEEGHRLPGGAGEADGLRAVAGGGPGDRLGCGRRGGAVRGG